MRNQFNLSREHKTSCDMGQLIPVLTEEVLPGDTWIHSATALTRVAPLANPLMHRVELRLHSFYVPNRILWDGWENFITGKDDTTPKPILLSGDVPGTLTDYMGIPPNTGGVTMDALPVRAANMIWNEFYRDQDLQAERLEDDISLPRCAWQKDYFTVARPQPQQGAGTDIPVNIGVGPVWTNSFVADGAQPLQILSRQAYAGTVTPDSQLVVDFQQSNAAIDIDDLRRSLALQRFAEARMRFGSRYIDYLRYIGVNPSDGRLDRPEYLGGGKETLSFSEVLSTAEVPTHSVGELYGHGIGMGKSNRYRKMFEEHGWVITFLSARPKTVYQSAVPRKFLRATAMDYWQKELETLPWQEISEQEVHEDGDPAAVFGYVPRYEEYRHGVSEVSSTLRGGLENDWHMGREFLTPPVLNGSFVECTPTDRVYQDANQPELIINVMHNIKARRFVGEMASMGTDL